MGQGDIPYAEVPGAPEWAKYKPPTAPPEDIEAFLKEPPEPPRSCPTGTTLYLCKQKLNDTCAEFFARTIMNGDWKHITYLNIGENDITHRGFGEICGALSNDTMPLLDNFTFEENPLTDEGAKAFAMALPHLPKLKVFNCIQCGIGDVGIEAMFAAIKAAGPAGGVGSNFYGFYLNRNPFSDAGMIAICEAMVAKSMPIMEHFDLNGCPVGDEGCLRLADCIEDGAFDFVRYISMGQIAATKDGFEVINNVCDEYGKRTQVRF